MHNARIEINKQQFITNLQAIYTWVNRSRKVKLCLPVKANAYGHGLLGMATLAEPYVDYLAVACLDEGVTLRHGGIKKPILVFGAFSQEQIYDLIIHNLEITISSLLRARQVFLLCQQLNLSCKVHIKIDTGMNRVGVRPDSADELMEFITKSSCMKLVGIYSHLASSDKPDDEFTWHQIEQFKLVAAKAKQVNPDILCHLANSGGVCYYFESYFDMVRPGILSYGYLPDEGADLSGLALLKACLSLKTQVIYFKVVAKGASISYNQQYVTPCQTRVVTIPVGYGDGYPRLLSNCGEVLLHGHKYTVAGTICMDMFMVDIGPNGHAYVGDEVVLVGRQGPHEITLTSLAQKCSTIIYEILCNFSDRLPRIYI